MEGLRLVQRESSLPVSVSAEGGTMSVGIIIEHHVRPGSREQVHAIWDQLLRPAIAANLGHEAYTYMYDIEDVDVIRAFQQ